MCAIVDPVQQRFAEPSVGIIWVRFEKGSLAMMMTAVFLCPLGDDLEEELCAEIMVLPAGRHATQLQLPPGFVLLLTRAAAVAKRTRRSCRQAPRAASMTSDTPAFMPQFQSPPIRRAR